MPICKVVEQDGQFAIVTNGRGEILQRIEILPPEVASVAVKAIANQPSDVLYDLGIAAKHDDGRGPKSNW